MLARRFARTRVTVPPVTPRTPTFVPDTVADSDVSSRRAMSTRATRNGRYLLPRLMRVDAAIGGFRGLRVVDIAIQLVVRVVVRLHRDGSCAGR